VRPVRVLIADDHPSIRERLRDLVDAEVELDLVAVAADGASALRLARKLHPDVLVIDHDLPDLDGVTVTRILRRQGNKARIVLYTMRHDVWDLARRSGVDICVGKDEPAAALVNSIHVLGRMPPRRAAHVLVVEDDPETRNFMRLTLEQDGLEVVTTGDGFEALAECERRAPGVVVLDLGLPTMSGQEFVTAYRQMSCNEAPLVVVSGANDARWIAADLRAGAFVPKPFSIEQLTQAVRQVKRSQLDFTS
jgi:DNA-binding response OmpR family regulator